MEPGFDNCLREFGEKTVMYWILDAEQGILFFNISRIFPGKKGVGIDEAERGIEFARKTANMSGYRGLHFFTGNSSMLAGFGAGEFDGVILSNVLDVMPKKADESVLRNLDRVLAPEYWFIKLNPFYSPKDLKRFDYQKMGDHLYEEDGVLRLHQETTEHWKRITGLLWPRGTLYGVQVSVAGGTEPSVPVEKNGSQKIMGGDIARMDGMGSCPESIGTMHCG